MDAVGISIGAAVLGLPLVSAIGILVFVGAFVPVVGALVSGSVAVLVALVAKGPLVALIMLAVVIGVQQLEAHVLQPFLLGRAVSVHPLAVILSIATGVIVAGIVGALIAVPTAAVLNTDRQPPGRQRRRPRTTQTAATATRRPRAGCFAEAHRSRHDEAPRASPGAALVVRVSACAAAAAASGFCSSSASGRRRGRPAAAPG